MAKDKLRWRKQQWKITMDRSLLSHYLYLIDKGMLVCLFTNNHRKKIFHKIVNVQARNKNFAIRLGCKKNIKKSPFCRDDDAENEKKILRNTLSCCHFILEIYTIFVGIFFSSFAYSICVESMIFGCFFFFYL